MNDTSLFPDDAPAEAEAKPPRSGPGARPRLRTAQRDQVRFRPGTLEDTIPDDHDVRTVWAVVCSWDLDAFLDPIQARGSNPGRPATDPRILIALWLYAAIEGVAGARELERLCEQSDPYRWILGGVSINHHTLADFRVASRQAIDGLLTQMLAVLIRGEAVSVTRIAQDGTRVRVSAGTKSFKKAPTLEQAHQKAKAHLELIEKQAERLGEAGARRAAAESRAAREKLERIERARAELAAIEAAKAAQKDKPSKARPPRASMTDPDARIMKMPDGGFRPAFNVQLAVDATSRAVVGVDVTNAGGDAGLAGPMRQQVEARTGQQVKEHLLDGGYKDLAEVDSAAASGSTLYMPLPSPKKPGVDPHQPKRGDSDAVAEWRRRMGTDQAKGIYKARARTVETVNGELKAYRGLRPFLVRGLEKARCVALWCALAYNIVHLGEAYARLAP